ncbi:MAG TPA: HlyD family efflux transporter periplasmic adaptor subunit [Chitinophagaceae bacterium]|nr:HlyD family efflux transporter periplasmic adaptor subunit [Chitinophagaceae bacterium]
MTNLEYPQWSSFKKVYRYNKRSRVRYWFYGLMTALAIILFLPWTQNIRAKGTVTTLRQEQRPQQLNTIIPGRVIKWYVKEGDYVKAGDTILQLAEIKDDYLDPQLLSRTKEQLSAKSLTVDYYKNKVGTSGTQINALGEALQLKMDQLRNKLQQLQLKVQSDSMESIAATNDFKIATLQFSRQKAMYDSGLVSLTQLEQRNQSYQNSLAKKVSAENKLQNARQDLTITRIEMNATQQDYMEKIAKAQGDQFQSLSQIATGQGDIAKLENQYSNYSIRNGLYFITAPQSGQITKARKAGIGEIVKDSEMIVEIVPDQVQYAVELFVRPLDLPLVSNGQKVRFMFDGFPAIVFSGWPNTSYGTFGGKVVAVESSVSYNGKFRILVTEDPADKPWPRELKMGTGAQGMALLKDVPIWYELWRNINGFPPDYYKAGAEPEKK